MKITTIVMALVLAGATAFAEEQKVEVTSFRYSGSRTYSAELCGKVVGDVPVPAYVKVTVDADGSKPGIYNVIVGREKSFCVAVSTYRGTASAALWEQSTKSNIVEIEQF